MSGKEHRLHTPRCRNPAIIARKEGDHIKQEDEGLKGSTKDVGADVPTSFDPWSRRRKAGENGAPAAVACRLHVAFHGCLQYVDAIHDRFFRDAGYNAFADANHVVVLYPQATSWRRLTDPSGLTANPDGCWDWWGHAGDDAYFTRDGKRCGRWSRACCPEAIGSREKAGARFSCRQIASGQRKPPREGRLEDATRAGGWLDR
jgi:hypothetical protein